MGIGNFVISILLTATFAISILAGILEALDVTVPYIAMTATGCVAAMLMQLFFLAKERVQILGVAAMLLVPCMIGLFCKTAVSGGIAILCNRILEFAGAVTGIIYQPYSVGEQVSEESALLAVTIILIMWLVCGLSCLQRDFHPLLSMGVLIFVVLINGLLPQTTAGAWLFVTSLCVGLHFARHRLGDQRLLPAMVVMLLFMTGVVGLFSVMDGEPLEERKNGLTASVRQHISDAITEHRYGDGKNRAMPMGDFENLGDLEFSDNKMLKIKGATYESLYLRGFVGGIFDGIKWTGIDGEILTEKKSTFYWLHDGGFFGQNLLAKSTQILDPEVEKEILEYEIENLGADGRVYYTPYELTSLQADGQMILTNQLLTEDDLSARGWTGWSNYEIKTLKNQVKRYPELILTLIENLKAKKLVGFRKAESHYNRFVYENYTYLSKDEQKLMEKYLGKAEFNKGTHMAYEDAKMQILHCLDENVIYAEKLLSDSDGHFVKNFLENDKSGYSVHYATTAALMFRYYGIPARYVEGYLITPDTVKAAAGSESLILTDRDAHAWVEYYQDGIGWLPFEATPPYRDIMEQPEQLQSANQQSVSESGPASLGMEMTEDNYEPEELEREEEKHSLPWGGIVLGGLILIMLMLLVLTGLHLWRRRKRLAARKSAFLQDDLNLAVAAIFKYCMALHTALGITHRNCSIYDYETEINEIGGA
ncbi:MAG: transglutaminase domain-containing protein, partial [Firmicutes bacterium]|nr:transglutaminase domain-containing protein [Bacillota bacterium]